MGVRTAVESEVDDLVSFVADPSLRAIDPDQLRADFAAGRMRPEWSRVLVVDGAIVGRALWWGHADGNWPVTLDTLDFTRVVADRIDAGRALLDSGHRAFTHAGSPAPPPYTLRLDPQWRHDDAASEAVRWRIAAAARSGLDASLERLQYVWRHPTSVPNESGRLRFRKGSDDEFIDLFARASFGTLDADTRADVEAHGAIAQAHADFEFYTGCPGDRSWWRVAERSNGTVVGFVIPSATAYHSNIGYLGVLPEHRGSGFSDDLLAAATRQHADAGATVVTATVDLDNRPMSAAFDRCGYTVDEIRLVLRAST